MNGSNSLPLTILFCQSKSDFLWIFKIYSYIALKIMTEKQKKSSRWFTWECPFTLFSQSNEVGWSGMVWLSPWFFIEDHYTILSFKLGQVVLPLSLVPIYYSILFFKKWWMCSIKTWANLYCYCNWWDWLAKSYLAEQTNTLPYHYTKFTFICNSKWNSLLLLPRSRRRSHNRCD